MMVDTLPCVAGLSLRAPFYVATAVQLGALLFALWLGAQARLQQPEQASAEPAPASVTS